MPHPLELPRMLRAIVPLVRGEWLAGFGRGIIDKTVGCLVRESWHGRFTGLQPRLLPVLSAIGGALKDLPEPATGLRRVNAVGLRRRALQMVNFPARKKWPFHLPVFAVAIRTQNKCSLFRSHKHAHFAHSR